MIPGSVSAESSLCATIMEAADHAAGAGGAAPGGAAAPAAAAAAAAAGGSELQRLKDERKAVRQQQTNLKKAIRNEVRKQTRLKKAAKKLSVSDLMQVMQLKNAAAAAPAE